MDLGNYVPVNVRLIQALVKWPELRVQETGCEMIGDTMICTVTVWRSPDDTLPSIASASEPVPGRTPFTRGSERMVGFTSALGRALGYMGIGISGGMASADEVRAAGGGTPDIDIVASLRTVNTDKPAPKQFPPNGQIKAPSDAQKRLLKALGYKGEIPATLSECSNLINTLKETAAKSEEAPF